MAFVGEKVTNERDKKYIASKGFTYITGEPLERARSWAVDREREMILVSRGGGGPELPEGYALWVDGIIVDMEGHETHEGSSFSNDLRTTWDINRISVPKIWFENGCGSEKLKEIIVEAFTAYSYRRVKVSQLQKVTVKINAEPKQKYNAHGEEVLY